MARPDKLTLLVLLDAFRWDYLTKKDTPFLWGLKSKSTYIEKLHNPGGYCERSVFMTGAGPDVTGNYFAMSLMPIGYKRAYWEPKFNIPMDVRGRLCMTEDVEVDFEPGSFDVESFWDVMRKENKKFAVEACVALGIQSYRGVTTHGTRPLQLMDKIKDGVDFAYIQFSETDQQMHIRGTRPEERKEIVQWADSQVKWLYEESNKLYKEVDLIVFGDHGMMNVTEHIDLPLEYPPFTEGWDYLYLKSSAAIQFWVFNDKVEKYIRRDPKLNQYGTFSISPSKRQGDIIWVAKPGVLVSPCHFHPKWDAPKAMHGYDSHIPEMHGMALVYPRKKQIIKRGSLKDICAIVSKSVGIREPKHNEGKHYER